jgi:hypothetical protein
MLKNRSEVRLFWLYYALQALLATIGFSCIINTTDSYYLALYFGLQATSYYIPNFFMSYEGYEGARVSKLFGKDLVQKRKENFDFFIFAIIFIFVINMFYMMAMSLRYTADLEFVVLFSFVSFFQVLKNMFLTYLQLSNQQEGIYFMLIKATLLSFCSFCFVGDDFLYYYLFFTSLSSLVFILSVLKSNYYQLSIKLWGQYKARLVSMLTRERFFFFLSGLLYTVDATAEILFLERYNPVLLLVFIVYTRYANMSFELLNKWTLQKVPGIVHSQESYREYSGRGFLLWTFVILPFVIAVIFLIGNWLYFFTDYSLNLLLLFLVGLGLYLRLSDNYHSQALSLWFYDKLKHWFLVYSLLVIVKIMVYWFCMENLSQHLFFMVWTLFLFIKFVLVKTALQWQIKFV